MHEAARLLSLVGLTAVWFLAPAAVGAPAMNGGQLPIEVASASDDVFVTVVKGDHLWSISEHHLASLWNRRALDSEISPYWRRVILANAGRLRSGDPDLIYPGETVLLPEMATGRQ